MASVHKIANGVLVATLGAFWICTLACNDIPTHVSRSPKIIEADGNQYTACTGDITVYEPSREVAESSQRTYEITFTDNYGGEEDLQDVRTYTVRSPKSGEVLDYAMPPEAVPSNTGTTYSGGQPIQPGDIVTFGKGEGKARWLGPGKWEPVPCGR
jgi:hypothetical protein